MPAVGFGVAQDADGAMAATREPDYDEIDELVTKRAGWRHPDDFPERLYHYTSSAAFLSIVKDNALWFSDFRYMNDLSELR